MPRPTEAELYLASVLDRDGLKQEGLQNLGSQAVDKILVLVDPLEPERGFKLVPDTTN